MNDKVFLIGFNKCGNTSFTTAFKQSHIKSIQWDRGRLAQSFLKNKNTGLDPLSDYKQYQFYSDMIHLDYEIVYEAFLDFEYLYEYYPDAYYILNTRNMSDWIISRVNHPKFLERYKSVLNTNDNDVVFEFWIEQWSNHHTSVRQFFKGNEKFMEYDINLNDFQELKDFLPNNMLKLNVFPHSNSTAPRLKK